MNSEEAPDTGVIYLAFGYEYLIQALFSIRSLKIIHPEIPVTIITNIEIGNIFQHEFIEGGIRKPVFDEIISVDADPEENRDYKTRIHEFTPYQRTLYVDTDTEFKRSIKEGFKLLDYFDVCMPSYPKPPEHMINWWDGDICLGEIELDFSSYWAGGIKFFDRDRAAPLFDEWNRLYHKYGYAKDQYSLIHAAFVTDVRIHPLDLTWDATDKTQNWHPMIKEHMRIYHYTYVPWKRLREFERNVADLFVDTSDPAIQKQQEEFRSKYSRRKVAYNLIQRNRVVQLFWFNGLKPLFRQL